MIDYGQNIDLAVRVPEIMYIIVVQVQGSAYPYASVGSFTTIEEAHQWMDTAAGDYWVTEKEREAVDAWLGAGNGPDYLVDTFIIPVRHYAHISFYEEPPTPQGESK